MQGRLCSGYSARLVQRVAMVVMSQEYVLLSMSTPTPDSAFPLEQVPLHVWR